MPRKQQTTRREAPQEEEEPEWVYTPPKFTINLAHPPQNRFDHVCSSPAMREAIQEADIDNLFDSIVEMEFLPFLFAASRGDSATAKLLAGLVKKGIRGLARIVLRRVYTDQETQELRGISRGTGIPLFLLVCFNVLLDLLLGCTSGGVLFDALGSLGSHDRASGDVWVDEGLGKDNGNEEEIEVVAAGDGLRGGKGYGTGRFRQTAYRRARQQGQTEGLSQTGTRKARLEPKDKDKRRIAHFRTLDWGMDPLRHLVVELEYVRHEGGPVIARTVGYFGYVGVLTGVRQGLSLSLNHRATHDRSTWGRRLSFRWNQLMVLLGRRPSISSTLRFVLLHNNGDNPGYNGAGKNRDQDEKKIQRWNTWRFLDLAHPRMQLSREGSEAHELHSATDKTLDMESIATALPMSPSTAAYLIFCTPEQAYSLEVDNRQIVSVQSSATFLTTTNHDMADESNPTASAPTTNGNPTLTSSTQAAAICGMEEILAESMDRKKAANRAYLRARRSHTSRSRTGGIGGASESSGWSGLSLEEIVGILNYGDIVERDVTHYAVVMDAGSGKILWRRGYWANRQHRT